MIGRGFIFTTGGITALLFVFIIIRKMNAKSGEILPPQIDQSISGPAILLFVSFRLKDANQYLLHN